MTADRKMLVERVRVVAEVRRAELLARERKGIGITPINEMTLAEVNILLGRDPDDRNEAEFVALLGEEAEGGG